MIRLFNVHYPSRTVWLAGGEALVLVLSFLLGIMFCLGTDSFQLLSQRQGLYKLVAVVAAMQFSIYCFDLYDRQRVSSSGRDPFSLGRDRWESFPAASRDWIRVSWFPAGQRSVRSGTLSLPPFP